MANIVAVLVLITLWGGSRAWDNAFDKELYKVCPYNQYVSQIKSEHNNHYEDRRFAISCRSAPSGTSPTRCYWSGWVNNYDQHLAFQCNHYGFIHGMRSIHHNHYEDRKWRFYCCEREGYTVSQCYYTQRTDWDGYFNQYVPNGSVMRGMTSTHSNHYEDRQFKFQICKLRKT